MKRYKTEAGKQYAALTNILRIIESLEADIEQVDGSEFSRGMVEGQKIAYQEAIRVIRTANSFTAVK